MDTRTKTTNDPVVEKIIGIHIVIEDLICPITKEIFFEPVLAMPCGHCFENKASGEILGSACPSCRQDIMMFGVALDKRRDLDQALANNQALYAQIYFNLDHFALIAKQNEFATATGQRFIKVLQNAANHLNDKASDGEQKNKSAAEVLISSYHGRELLRNDEKIRSLLTHETLDIAIKEKTIREWLSMENNELESKKLIRRRVKLKKNAISSSSHSMFASTSTSSSNISSSASSEVVQVAPLQPLPIATNNVWRRVIWGREVDVKEMLVVNPDLIREKATVVDYSARIIDLATPFQAGLRAGDVEMCTMIKTVWLAHAANGQAELDAQFTEIFPNGLNEHVREQQQNTFDFSAIRIAINNASESDVEYLNANPKSNNGSALCVAMHAFRADFTASSCNEKIFNPFHLLKALEIYGETFDEWKRHSEKQKLYWRQVIGYVQRYLPTCYAQAFCMGLAYYVELKWDLKRELAIHYDQNWRPTIHSYFPLDRDLYYNLGFDFGIYSYYQSVQSRSQKDVTYDVTRLYRMCIERKIANMQALCNLNQVMSPRPRT